MFQAVFTPKTPRLIACARKGRRKTIIISFGSLDGLDNLCFIQSVCQDPVLFCNFFDFLNIHVSLRSAFIGCHQFEPSARKLHKTCTLIPLYIFIFQIERAFPVIFGIAVFLNLEKSRRVWPYARITAHKLRLADCSALTLQQIRAVHNISHVERLIMILAE